jgi:hypothetical protein
VEICNLWLCKDGGTNRMFMGNVSSIEKHSPNFAKCATLEARESLGKLEKP